MQRSSDNHYSRSRRIVRSVVAGLAAASLLLELNGGGAWRTSARAAIPPQKKGELAATKSSNQERHATALPSMPLVSVPGRPDTGPVGEPDEDTDPETGVPQASNDPTDNYKQALTLIEKSYYGTPITAAKKQTLTYEAIRGMLASLHDPFTSFLDADDWNAMQATTRGDFEGIGAVLEQVDATIRVKRLFHASPAESSGLRSNDIVVRIDGRPVTGQRIDDVVRRIKGRFGSRVRLAVLRGQQTLEFTIQRARVEPLVVDYWLEDTQAKIGHIVLSEFNEKSMEQLNRALSDLDRQGMRGLVFDLRSNPGGLLDVAIAVASAFIPTDSGAGLRNTVVFIQEGTGSEKRMMLRGLENAHRRMPMAVLVNHNSASASEIVCAALKDYGVGTIIGERTFGKGRVQTLYPLDDGSALRLTTALYFPPRHYDINFKHNEAGERIPDTGGVLPDIPVGQNPHWKEEDFEDKRNDWQLQKALGFLRGRLKGQTIVQARQQIARTLYPTP